MFGAQKILHKSFARLSPVFALVSARSEAAPALWLTFALRALAAAVLAVATCGSAHAGTGADASSAVKRQSASTQFARAEEQRAALNSKPSEKRTLADYKLVVTAYRRVALITPRAPEVPDSLLALAEVYTEMGDRFGRTYFQSAVDSYQFLVRQYPTSKFCQDAQLRAAKLQRDRLGDSAQAKKTYEDFLKRYPRSSRKREAMEALAELALLQNPDAPPTVSAPELKPAAPMETAEEIRPVAPVHSGGKSTGRTKSGEIPRVRKIRAIANGDATRITIDLDDSVQYSSGRIANPDRIFFDLHAAKLTPEVARGNVHVDGGLLTAVRVAQNHDGVVRIVLDVNGVTDYTASLTNNPSQLLIDLYGNSAAEPVRTAKNKRSQPAATEDAPVQTVSAKESDDAAVDPPAARSAINNTINGGVNGGATTAAASNPSATLRNRKTAKSNSVTASASNAKPDLIKPASIPQPTRDGQSTLTRTLGLKIGRIVIDAGHGGHDTGTIGPTGLMEKDLCLDVALRLGKIIQQKLPGTDVVYTRSDDTFVPLEERTAIANQAKADLFISIHANSSNDHAARGIETYYLNMKGSAEAMEVAARENATGQGGVHDLQDLVAKIARTEKIDESREFAEDVQDSLMKRVQKTSKPVKDRGVRKAPFVVLIGADMPSILTEISFLSNPTDEQLLKKPEQRQRVAEGLYQGMASYLQSMNSVTVNLTAKPGPSRPAAPAVEQSRNQN